MRGRIGFTLILVSLGACTARRPIGSPAAVVAQREFVDLEPGWRLQIVAPLTRDGGGMVASDEPAQSDSAARSVTMKASSNLIGYETAFWEITARQHGGGVQLRLASAQMTREGIASEIEAPTKALLHVTRDARFLRLFYLIRKSESDHEMVMAGVDRADRLEPFTAALKANPAEACHSGPHIYCEWVPYGMAVRPEKQKTIDGVLRWAPLY